MNDGGVELKSKKEAVKRVWRKLWKEGSWKEFHYGVCSHMVCEFDSKQGLPG